MSDLDDSLREDCRKILSEMDGELLETAYRFITSLHQLQTRWDYVCLASAEVRARENRVQTREALVERLFEKADSVAEQKLRPKLLKDADKKDSTTSRTS